MLYNGLLLIDWVEFVIFASPRVLGCSVVDSLRDSWLLKGVLKYYPCSDVNRSFINSQRGKTPKAKTNGKSKPASKTKSSSKQQMEEPSSWAPSDEEAKNAESESRPIHEPQKSRWRKFNFSFLFLSCFWWTKKSENSQPTTTFACINQSFCTCVRTV